MKWLPTAGITVLRFKIKTLTGKHELTGKKGKIMYKYDAKSLKAEEFINDEEIRETLAYADANKDNVELIDAIIAKARGRKGLNHREASVLLARFRKKSRKSMRWRSRSRKTFTATVSCCLHRCIFPTTV